MGVEASLSAGEEVNPSLSISFILQMEKYGKRKKVKRQVNNMPWSWTYTGCSYQLLLSSSALVGQLSFVHSVAPLNFRFSMQTIDM